MSRHQSTETFQLDLRSTPSHPHLGPSRSSSLQSQTDNMDQQEVPNEKPHKLDLYSIPVFLLESLVLAGLAYAAYFIHFQYHHEPFVSGFYCDDIAYKSHWYLNSSLTKVLNERQNEVTFIALLLAVPIILIIFCELVNSMFGALKFRQIRALCTCCKLHSITRRSIRFSGAFVLGFLIVIISCDILANSTGRLRPYFAQECPGAYEQCAIALSGQRPTASPEAHSLSSSAHIQDLTNQQSIQSVFASSTRGPPVSSARDPSTSSSGSGNPRGLSASPTPTLASSQDPSSSSRSPPIDSEMPETELIEAASNSSLSSGGPSLRRLTRAAATDGSSSMLPPVARFIVERQWISLENKDLSVFCRVYPADVEENSSRRLSQLAMSWPSFPAAIFTYACLFVSTYLSYVGTARPFRIITCVLVVLLLLLATAFDVQIVKEHYHHWDDVVAGAVLASIVALFVLVVYLNKFKDTHYYENQKLFSNRSSRSLRRDSFRGYSNEAVSGQYELNKINNDSPSSSANNNNSGIVQNGLESGVNSMSNNDLAMRYFQIPRANYRGAPRPVSSVNQMR